MIGLWLIYISRQNLKTKGMTAFHSHALKILSVVLSLAVPKISLHHFDTILVCGYIEIHEFITQAVFQKMSPYQDLSAIIREIRRNEIQGGFPDT